MCKAKANKKNMSLNDFYECIKNMKFTLSPSGIIRNSSDICPVSACANKKLHKTKYNSGNFREAGHYLGLSKEDTNDIAIAADRHAYSSHRIQIRSELLKRVK